MDTSNNTTTSTAGYPAVDTSSLTSSMLWLFNEIPSEVSTVADLTNQTINSSNYTVGAIDGEFSKQILGQEISNNNSSNIDEEPRQQPKADVIEEVIMVIYYISNDYNTIIL
jgi:hypothetical protein